MKNLFLSVVLLLSVSFAFANDRVEKVSSFDVEKTIKTSLDSPIKISNNLKSLEYKTLILSKKELADFKSNKPGDLSLFCWKLNEDYMYCIIAKEL